MDTIDKMKAAEILDKAADEMMARGSCKGISIDIAGRVCMEGALNIVLSQSIIENGDDIISAYDYARKTLHIELEKSVMRPCGIITWNDHIARSDDERIELFRKTAKALRQEAQGG
jgi:hypothetical protein